MALVLRKENQALAVPYLDGQQVDLHGLLSNDSLKLGIVAERSYGTQIDAILRQLPDGVLSRHYGNDATANLLQMQQLGRLRMVLGYWPEVRYLIQQQGGTGGLPVSSGAGGKALPVSACGLHGQPSGARSDRAYRSAVPALRRDVLPALCALAGSGVTGRLSGRQQTLL